MASLPIKPATIGGKEFYFLIVENPAWAEKMLGVPEGTLWKKAKQNVKWPAS